MDPFMIASCRLSFSGCWWREFRPEFFARHKVVIGSGDPCAFSLCGLRPNPE